MAISDPFPHVPDEELDRLEALVADVEYPKITQPGQGSAASIAAFAVRATGEGLATPPVKQRHAAAYPTSRVVIALSGEVADRVVGLLETESMHRNATSAATGIVGLGRTTREREESRFDPIVDAIVRQAEREERAGEVAEGPGYRSHDYPHIHESAAFLLHAAGASVGEIAVRRASGEAYAITIRQMLENSTKIAEDTAREVVEVLEPYLSRQAIPGILDWDNPIVPEIVHALVPHIKEAVADHVLELVERTLPQIINHVAPGVIQRVLPEIEWHLNPGVTEALGNMGLAVTEAMSGIPDDPQVGRAIWEGITDSSRPTRERARGVPEG